MRIISKYKDFYDFVVNEPDNNKIYIRNIKEVVFNEEDHKKLPEKTYLSPLKSRDLNRRGHTSIFDGGFISILIFCDKMHYYFSYENKIYWNYEDIPNEIIKKINLNEKKYKYWNNSYYQKWYYGKNPIYDMLYNKKLGWIIDKHTKEPIKTDLNKIFNTPIILINDPNYHKIILNPKLSEIGFNKTISPTEAYQDIYNWIPYNEIEVPSSPDDMNRYEAKGFDKKFSFRPNIKF